MSYINRTIESEVRASIRKGESILLLGPRQTGKTTMLSRVENNVAISLVHPQTRQLFERDSRLLEKRVKEIAGKAARPLVFIDEIQKVPSLMDAVQHLIDTKQAQFLLTGSSARKLRRGKQVNLLPGRVLLYRMDPLTLTETPGQTLEHLLLYGSLPGILQKETESDREHALSSYVTAYLEEEVRAEALVRNLGSFGQFLALAASESGSLINFSKLSQEIGVAHTTVRDYYGILEDCLIIERIEPIRKSQSHRRLTKTQKHLFFDLGIRRIAAGEGVHPPRDTWGRLFEQFVGIELLRHARLRFPQTHVRFWRDNNGPEIDWVIDDGDQWIPVEVKWTELPREKDARTLRLFLREESRARRGYIICRAPHALDLGGGVHALPWQELRSVVAGR